MFTIIWREFTDRDAYQALLAEAVADDALVTEEVPF